jgi:DNA-binding response OmpR family regulator
VTTINSSSHPERPCILIADDDYDLRDALSEILGECGFDILEARDGQEALAIMERQVPSLVLLDLTMPQMSGWELLAEMDRRTDLGAVPVLVFSANEVRLPAGRAFLAKPFRVEQLLERVGALLGGKGEPGKPLSAERAKP